MRHGPGFAEASFVRLPVLVGLLAALASLAPARADDGGAAAKARPDVSSERLMRDLRYLASDELEGRGSGTKGCELAAKMIAERFEEAGIAPGGAPLPHGQRGYEQAFELTAGVKAGPGTGMSVAAGDEARPLELGKDFRPLGFSASGDVEGEVVFCGYGIASEDPAYDDFKGIDLKGRIALVLDGVPTGASDEAKAFGDRLLRNARLRFKAIAARERGAVGLIVCSSEPLAPGEAPSLLETRERGTVGDAGIVVVDLARPIAEGLVRTSGLELLALQDQIITSRAPRSRPLKATARIACEMKRRTHRTSNVLGVLRGSDPALKDEVVMIGAHYDHLGHGELGGSLSEGPGIHHGADDNASGTSVVLEVARLLAAGPRPRRTVVFALWSAEELGLLGSGYYVKHPLFPVEKTVAYVNLDMVGRMRDGKMTVGGMGTALEWPSVVDRALEGLGIQAARDQEGFGPSDHSSFYGQKVPVLFLFTGAHADYHRPSDTPEKIEVEGLVKITRLARRLVESLAASDAKPTYQSTGGNPHGGELVRRGPSVYLGTIPDYADTEGPGVRLAGVRQGSPASKAGLQAGDRIVGFDGHDVRDIHEYTYALFRKKPGEEVDIIVLRGEARVTLHAVMGQKGGAPEDEHHGAEPHGEPAHPELPEGHPPVPEGHPKPQKDAPKEHPRGTPF